VGRPPGQSATALLEATGSSHLTRIAGSPLALVLGPITPDLVEFVAGFCWPIPAAPCPAGRPAQLITPEVHDHARGRPS